MFPWGSTQRPIIVKVSSEETAEKVARICNHYGMHYIMGFEQVEDLTDLRKALKEKLAPTDPYGECPCGSNRKYKFCCINRIRNLDIYEFVANFAPKV